MTTLSEQRENLWRLIVSPILWAVHFLGCYIGAAVYCAKVAGPLVSLGAVRLGIVGLTLVAATGIVLNGWGGWKRYRYGAEPVPFDSDTPEDRHRFLGFATVLLAGLSLVATLFSGSVALFFEDCR